MADIAELVVKVTSEGLDQVNATLTRMTKQADLTAGKINLTSKEFKKGLRELQAYAKAIDTVTKAYARMEKAATAESDKVKKAENDKRIAMDKTQAEAIKDDKKITASRKKMWDDAMREFKKHERERKASDKRVTDNAIREGKREQAARDRLASHPFSAGLAKLLGQAGGATAQEQAKGADIFRGKVFDFLVMFGTAKAAGALVTGYLIKPLEEVIGTAIDFERQWALVTQTVTGSTEQMTQVRKEFLDLIAKSPFDPEEITAAARALGELGVESKEIIKASEYILRFSVASGIATDEAATLVGQTLAVGGVARPTADEIGQLASAVLDMGTSFAIGNKGVLTTMLRVSALIPLFHLSQASALALSTAMGSLGIKGERGATALQAFFTQARSAEGIKLERFANVLGKTVAETEALIRTNPGQFLQEFITGFNDMAASGYDVNKMLKDLGINQSRAQQVLGSLAAGHETLDEAMVKANETMGKTDELMRQSQIQQETVWGLTKQLGNAFWALGVSMTEGVLPDIKTFIGGMKDAVDETRGFIVAVKEFYDEHFNVQKKMQEELDRQNRERAEWGKGKYVMQQAGGMAPDITDPRYDPITGRVRISQPSTIPFIGDRAGRDEALRRQAAENKKEDAYRKELIGKAKSFDAAARSPAEQEAFRLGELNEMYKRTLITKEQYDKYAADAAKTRKEDEEALAKKSAQLTDEQRKYKQALLDSRTPAEEYADTLKDIAHWQTMGMNATQAAKLQQDAWNKKIAEEAALTKKADDAMKKHNEEVRKFAVNLNPIIEMEENIAKAREAAAKFPNIVTPEILEEFIRAQQRGVKLPEAYEKEMRIVQGIVERGMNAVADTMTDALFEGTTKGKDIMRAFAKDVTNILLEELLFKPVSEKIIDTFKEMQISDFTKVAKAGAAELAGPPAPGDPLGKELQRSAEETSKSITELGKGSLEALLDLTSGIGAFLSGLLLGQGGEGFTAGGFFKALGIGAAEGAISYYGKGLIPKGTVPDTSHEVPFSSQDGQSSYDPSGGAFGYDTGFSSSRASLMATSGSAMHTGTHGMAPPVNITVTALDPRTASSVIMSNMPVIERGMQRAVDRGAAYAKAHGRRR